MRRTKIFILSLLTATVASLLTTSKAYAFDLGGLKEKASSGTVGSGNSELVTIGKSLYETFGGNAAATKLAKGLMNSLQLGQYDKVFEYYDKIKKAGLSPKQLSSWNGIKNTISAFVLENGIETEVKSVAELVERTSALLKSDETGAALSYLKRIGSLDALSKTESSLISQIQAHVLPIVTVQ